MDYNPPPPPTYLLAQIFSVHKFQLQHHALLQKGLLCERPMISLSFETQRKSPRQWPHKTDSCHPKFSKIVYAPLPNLPTPILPCILVIIVWTRTQYKPSINTAIKRITLISHCTEPLFGGEAMDDPGLTYINGANLPSNYTQTHGR